MSIKIDIPLRLKIDEGNDAIVVDLGQGEPTRQIAFGDKFDCAVTADGTVTSIRIFGFAKLRETIARD